MIALVDEGFRNVKIELMDCRSRGMISRLILWLLIIFAIGGTVYAVMHIQEYHLRVPRLGIWLGDRRQPTTSPQFTFMRFNGLEETERTAMELDTTNQGEPSSAMMEQFGIGRESLTTSMKGQDEDLSSTNREESINPREDQDRNISIHSIDEQKLDTISLEPLVDKN